MLAVERRACIKETIQEQKSVAVSDLARRFDVTEETIRLHGPGVIAHSRNLLLQIRRGRKHRNIRK